MARSVSIDSLPLRNFWIGNEAIIGKYDDSKADKAGERFSEKNLYANPHDWKMCFWTGLGIWCSLHKDILDNQTERLFLHFNVKEGSAAVKFCEQMASVVKPHIDEVANHMSASNFNAYGFRKGAATYAVSGTTSVPFIPSIARRGKWSIGSIQDDYWHFGSVGDHYLGRILAGFDPHDASFTVLSPHWRTVDPMVNGKIKYGMQMTFGSMLVHHRQSVALLLRVFACMVYHGNVLIEQMIRVAGHDFNKIAILHNRVLLKELQELVTIEDD